jgi:hypothetical protein
MFRSDMLPPSSGSESKKVWNQHEAGGKLSLLFIPEDGGNMFIH